MKKVIALLLAVLMLASLAACSSTPANADAATPAETGTTPSADTTDTADTTETKDETPAAAGDVTIRMWTFLDPTNTSNGRSIALQKMIDRFEEENPGVTGIKASIIVLSPRFAWVCCCTFAKPPANITFTPAASNSVPSA